jgi:anaerobic magnesium-protoporphyrin IX monomethyl ester cyclase
MCLSRMREAAARIIAMAKTRGLDVVVAGSDASDDPGFYLAAGADAVAAGEGEYSVCEWLSAPGVSSQTLPGIATRSADGGLARGPVRPPVRDLDSIPSPAWDLIDIEAYRRVWARGRLPFTLPLATSRGCPFHCNWCAKPIWGQRYNAMTPARAASEVLRLKDLGARRVTVLDDIFGLKPGWVEEFSAELARLDARLPFKCLSRADLLTDRTVAGLARAGCEMVWIGAESGSQKILDAMEKGVTVEEIKAAARRLRSAGIKVAFFLQFGYPGEEEHDVEETLSLVDEAAPDDIGISVSYPLPGTRFHARVKDEMKQGTHWRDSSDLAMLFDSPHDTLYYRRLHGYAHSRFRLARALRSSEEPLPHRLMLGAWHGARGLVMRAALRLTARERPSLPHLKPELSRELAGTPTVQTGPGTTES